MIEHSAHAAAAVATSAPYVAAIPLAPLAGAVLLGLRGAAIQRRAGKGLVGAIVVSRKEVKA